jgi:hypothetical protein
MQTVKETVEQLGKSFAEFKTTNDEKTLKHLVQVDMIL